MSVPYESIPEPRPAADTTGQLQDAQDIFAPAAVASPADAPYAEYFKFATYCARGKTADHSTAEDAAQHAVVGLWRRLQNNTIAPTSLRGYLSCSARNAVLDHHREQRRREPHEFPWEATGAAAMPQDDSPEEQYIRLREPDERLVHLAGALASLPERARTAIELQILQEKSSQEIGVELGITDEAVRQLLRRTRKRLRKYIEKAMNGPFASSNTTISPRSTST